MSAPGNLAAPEKGTGTAVSFELERFEWTAADRLEVAGRWYGVRGRRFLRPTLDIEVDGQARRMLALLEHKPWAPDEGSEWIAAFTWNDEPIELLEADLVVAPDLSVELPAPGTAAGAKKSRAAQRSRRRAGGQQRRVAAPTRAALLEGRAAAEAEAERVAEELDRARAAHTAALDNLHRRMAADEAARHGVAEELEQARTEIAAAAATIEGLRAELEAASAARDAAVAATERVAQERDRALRERALLEHRREEAETARDTARQERNAWMSRARVATAGRDAIVAERDAALAARDQMETERDGAQRERDAAARKREAAVRERDAAVGDRDAAVRERDAAVRTRVAAARERAAVARRERPAPERTPCANGSGPGRCASSPTIPTRTFCPSPPSSPSRRRTTPWQDRAARPLAAGRPGLPRWWHSRSWSRWS